MSQQGKETALDQRPGPGHEFSGRKEKACAAECLGTSTEVPGGGKGLILALFPSSYGVRKAPRSRPWPQVLPRWYFWNWTFLHLQHPRGSLSKWAPRASGLALGKPCPSSDPRALQSHLLPSFGKGIGAKLWDPSGPHPADLASSDSGPGFFFIKA